jgi:hypothetical protein
MDAITVGAVVLGGGTLRLGRHRFAVLGRAPELTLVPYDDGRPAFALTGTDYRSPVTDPAFAATRAHWDQPLVSESGEVYRSEYLAARLLAEHGARKLGAAGGGRRTDSSGLLLLLSPPGYGRTTLMEYVAERLGMLLMKVDGPALGRSVTSLDPREAPNADARREIEKTGFALAAGNNVLLYLDDIQHTSPELLQKFIPLCDATRTLNGHDLRGKRFAVCMAGNPYTESGQRFRVPDMLANRADVWNLGDVLSGKEDAFAASFVENALTSHPVLAPLAGRDRSDLDLLVRLAEGDPTARADRLVHPYAPAELDRVLAVLRHLLTARATVLAVNAAYIASAAQTDASRTEPPFRLQGSYRNLKKIVQRISPVMDDAELAAVVDFVRAPSGARPRGGRARAARRPDRGRRVGHRGGEGSAPGAGAAGGPARGRFPPARGGSAQSRSVNASTACVLPVTMMTSPGSTTVSAVAWVKSCPGRLMPTTVTPYLVRTWLSPRGTPVAAAGAIVLTRA